MIWPHSNIIESYSSAPVVLKVSISVAQRFTTVATAAGKVFMVVYYGYGNLVIIITSAYAHNDTILVREQQMNAGQQLSQWVLEPALSDYTLRSVIKKINPMKDQEISDFYTYSE